MLSTEKLCALLNALGGNASSLPDFTDVTIIDAIIAQINTSAAVTAAEVVTAINALSADQVTTVKTKLDVVAVTAANVAAAIDAMDAAQLASVKAKLGITEVSG